MTTRTRGRAGGGGRGLTRPQVRDVLSMLYPEQQIGLWGLGDNALTQVKDASRRQNHGVYSGTGVTLNQPGLNNGGCALFDGTNGFANVYSAQLATDLNNQELTAAILVKMLSSTPWTDGNQHYGLRFGVDGNNFISLSKGATNGQLIADYRAGGTVKQASSTGNTDLDWFLFVMTVSKAADQLKAYKWQLDKPGGQIGTTTTGLGTWSGALAATLCCLGASITTPSNVHSGWLMGGALWTKAIPEQDLQYAAAQLFA